MKKQLTVPAAIIGILGLLTLPSVGSAAGCSFQNTGNAVIDQLRLDYCNAKIPDPNSNTDYTILSALLSDSNWACTGYYAYQTIGDDPIYPGTTFQQTAFTDNSNETYSITFSGTVDTLTLTPTQIGLVADSGGPEVVARLVSNADGTISLLIERTTSGSDRNFIEYPAVSDPSRNAWTYTLCSKSAQ